MGKNKMKKSTTQNQNNSSKSNCLSTSFVPIVSCFYCDEVSFDVDDQDTYVDHLMKAHKILKNTKSLLEATLTLQNGKFQYIPRVTPYKISVHLLKNSYCGPLLKRDKTCSTKGLFLKYHLCMVYIILYYS